MKTYSVTVSATANVCKTVYIEADSEDDARKKAIPEAFGDNLTLRQLVNGGFQQWDCPDVDRQTATIVDVEEHE